MSATAEVDTKANLVRPLRVLAELIKAELDAGDQAAESAAEPYYRKAAPLLLEAKEGHYQGDTAGFYDWAHKKFGKSIAQIKVYVGYARASVDKPFKHLEDFQRQTKPSRYDHTAGRKFRDWTAPVDEVAERARREAFRLAQEDALTRAEEREAERKLANRLIDIGYKVLAKTLHPDKMHGDKEAMQRLVRVRDKLKHCI
jgi:hypothetical protein